MHIHFKVRVFDGTSETYEFTSQLFFDPATTSAVYATGVYAVARAGDDAQLARTASTAATARSSSSRSTPDGNGGYAGTFVVGLSGLPAAATGTGTGDRHREHASARRSPRRAFAARRPAAASCA